MNVTQKVFAALSLALVLATTVWVATERIGPGPLHPAHAAVADLRGSRGCAGCHERGGGATGPQSCGTCHAAVAAQLARRTGLHGALQADLGVRCAECHRDHVGSAPLLGPHSFAKAGIDDPQRYDHRHLPGFLLAGAHGQLACDRCHRDAFATDPPRGGRYLGLSTACTSCHEDRHEGAYGNDCAACHGQDLPFAAVPGFRHGGFALRDAHASHACDQCHPQEGPHAVAALQRTPQPVRACAACHPNPHAASSPAARPASYPIRDSDDCAACHATTSFTGATLSAERHAAAFALQGVHAQIACRECHGDRAQRPRWRDAAPRPADCAHCHESPHREPFVAAANAASGLPAAGCGGCHPETAGRFRDATVTAAQHAATGFVLEPPHTKVDCSGCHGEPQQPWTERFPGRAAADCRRCHEDVHRGQFADEPRYAQCTACHEPDHFAPPRFGIEEHAATAFRLRGLHEAVACSACHTAVQDGARVFAGTKQLCADCHRDVHEHRFTAALPAQLGGRTGCARCHDEHGFHRTVVPFDHDRWTSWPLTGAHGKASCQGCHPPEPRPTDGRRFGSAVGTACADCHLDVHRGQFALEDPRTQRRATDCARCHETSSFAPTRFDHARDTRFALDATHAKVPCARCHLPVATASGPVVRYKPLGTECRDCHRPGSAREERR